MAILWGPSPVSVLLVLETKQDGMMNEVDLNWLTAVLCECK